jgi:hypothetical protein
MRKILPAVLLCLVAFVPVSAEEAPPKRIAALTTVYNHNSHADVIISRLFQTDTLDGKGRQPHLKLVSLYVDQTPENDISRKFSREYGFPIYGTVKETLTCGNDRLAVDGILLVAEHGQYPKSEAGQTIYPKRRLFEQVVQVFRESGRVVPVFIDKHFADNWTDAKWIYDQCQELHIPVMAGSSLPTTWRDPPVDVSPDKPLSELLILSYHTLDAYGFHGLEIAQALAEQRQGGETGVKRVQCFNDDEVWKAGERGVYDPKMLEAALARIKQPLGAERTLQQAVPHPVLFVIEYADGLKVQMLTLNGRVNEWTGAWRYRDDPTITSAVFLTQEFRPLMHFSYLLGGVEQMFETGKPAWPPERTLMTSGILDAALISQKEGGTLLATPHLTFGYRTNWRWKPPPPRPPDRPLTGQ